MFAALLTIVICAILAIVMFKGEREHKEINNNYKNFKKNKKTVKVKGYKKTSKTIKKLKSKKTYYVRIRTYYSKPGEDYDGYYDTSSWSPVKKIKTK